MSSEAQRTGPDLDEIKAALAAPVGIRDGSRAALVTNAPTWLAWCVSEIETYAAERDTSLQEIELLQAEIERLEGLFNLSRAGIKHAHMERDAALRKMDAADAQCRALGAEIERLRALKQPLSISQFDRVVAERDAAPADRRAHPRFNYFTLCQKIDGVRHELLAWRACADQLAAAHHAFPFGGAAALAEYERLRAQLEAKS